MAKLGIVERRWYLATHNASGDECEAQYVVASTTKRRSNRRLLYRWKNLVTKTVLGWSVTRANLDDEQIARLDISLLGQGYVEEAQ